jgi:hypothetical protein
MNETMGRQDGDYISTIVREYYVRSQGFCSGFQNQGYMVNSFCSMQTVYNSRYLRNKALYGELHCSLGHPSTAALTFKALTTISHQ